MEGARGGGKWSRGGPASGAETRNFGPPGTSGTPLPTPLNLNLRAQIESARQMQSCNFLWPRLRIELDLQQEILFVIISRVFSSIFLAGFSAAFVWKTLRKSTTNLAERFRIFGAQSWAGISLYNTDEMQNRGNPRRISF